MLDNIRNAIKTDARIGWLARRVPDWGGWLLGIGGGLFAFYASMPASTQDDINRIASGDWQNVTLGSAVGLIVLIYSQWRSYRATVKPQIVTSDKTKITPPVITEAQARDIVERDTGRRPTGPVTRR